MLIGVVIALDWAGHSVVVFVKASVNISDLAAIVVIAYESIDVSLIVADVHRSRMLVI